MFLKRIRKKIRKKLKKTKNGILQELDSWKESYQARRDYCLGRDRRPFYELAGKYLPVSEEEIVVDIGAGLGYFADYLQLGEKFRNLYLLDADASCIQNLQGRFKNAILYKAPARIPLEESSVSFIHCSHMVEHLYYAELHAFLLEINRVLKPRGVFIISTPLLWENFYGEFSHVKPYYPETFIRFLCHKPGQLTLTSIDGDYSREELVYRYTTVRVGEWGAEQRWLDFLIQVSRWVLDIFKIKKYRKNGYTLVLRKG